MDKNKVCNEKTKEAAEQDIEKYINQNDSNSNTACKHLKFVKFASTIDQVLSYRLQLEWKWKISFAIKNQPATEKYIENRINQNNNDSNTTCSCLKFVLYASKIDQVI